MPRPQKQPLRPLTAPERATLEQVARCGAERTDRVARAEALLAVAAGSGFPIIVAVDGDHEGRREPFLRRERTTGKPLDLPYARHTPDHIHRL